jgi:type II secretory pathway pseudopilin PulG
MNKVRCNFGFGLIEVILSIALFSMTVTGLLAVLSFATGSTGGGAARGEALRLAHEGMEAARNMRSSYDPDIIGSGLVEGAYGVDTSDGVLRLDPMVDNIGIFTRTIIIEPISQHSFSVLVRVQWNDTTGHQSNVALDGYISNWTRRI